MPELPEVETVRRGLERTIVGKTVQSVTVRVPKLFTNPQHEIDRVLVGATVQSVERRAKVLLVHLANGWVLAIHLKMTGQVIVIGPQTTHSFVGGHPEKAYEQVLPHKHTHVIIGFSDDSTLYFNDLRKFGWLKLVDPTQVDTFIHAFHHGPEPLEDQFTLEYFTEGLHKRAITVKQLLLDQSFIAGVGNIYADEALFQAKIVPTRTANTVTKTEATRLFAAIHDVLNAGITYGGTSMNSYRNVEGTQGGMRQHLKVYGREGKACLVCGTAILRTKIGQRSSHYCPRCQR